MVVVLVRCRTAGRSVRDADIGVRGMELEDAARRRRRNSAPGSGNTAIIHLSYKITDL